MFIITACSLDRINIKRVDLTNDAHWILSNISDREDVTLSEVIEKYLQPIYRGYLDKENNI